MIGKDMDWCFYMYVYIYKHEWGIGRSLHLQRSTGGSGVVKVDLHILKFSICTVAYSCC